MFANFPRIYRDYDPNKMQDPNYLYANDEQLRSLFPWGCSELNRCAEFPKNLFFRYIKSRSICNIFMAIKYGIWSSPADKFKYESTFFDYNANKQCPTYYVLYHEQQQFAYIYGIARVDSMSANKSFKYWIQHDNPFLGIMHIKFIMVGIVVRSRKEEGWSVQDFRCIWQAFRTAYLPVHDMISCDFEEDKRRSQYKQDPELKKKLQKFSVEVENLPKYEIRPKFPEGRQNFKRYR